MNPLATAFKDHARAAGADLVGIAGIERIDGRIEQTFHGGRFIKRPRWLLPAKVEKN